MIFRETKLPGAFIIELEQFADERGFFANAWTEEELSEKKLTTHFVAGQISFSKRKGTLRGLHFQTPPAGQAKLVRCTSGAIYDVAVDLRRESPTFKQWVAVELTAQNRLMFYVPVGFAHGFQTLADETEVLYQVTAAYSPANYQGVRWNDPAFGIQWPDAERIIIARDSAYPDFQ